jgi:hypothetical protein
MTKEVIELASGATHTIVIDAKGDLIEDIWDNPSEKRDTDAEIHDPSVEYALNHIETRAVQKIDPDFATQPPLFT